MTLRFVVLEDMGMRPRTLTAICKVMTSPGGDAFAAFAPEDWLMIPPDIAEFGPSDLAAVDAIFVDFDLQSSKTAGHTSWDSFSLVSGVEFVPRTGMSALLYVRELMETEEYRSARASYVAGLPEDQRQWLGASGITRLFSFVEAQDPVSRLFVAAAASWFGATYFNAQHDLHSPDALQAAVRQLATGADDPLSDRQARSYRTSVARAFDDLLTTEFRGRNQQLIPSQHEWPSNFDLYRIYLEHRGKIGFGQWRDPVGFRDAVFEVCGIELEPRNVPPASAGPVFSRMQVALESFHASTDPNAKDWQDWSENDHDPRAEEWPDWDGLKSHDEMLDYLQSSRLFWTSGDVQAAYQEHVRRTGQSQ